MMAGPKTARNGNLVAAFGMLWQFLQLFSSMG